MDLGTLPRTLSATIERPRYRWGFWLLVIAGLALVPPTTTDYVTLLVFTGLVFAMLGVSWNLLAGYAGQISLGHSAVFGIGAFVAAWFTTPLQAGFPEAITMPVPVAIILGGLAAGLLALITGPILFRLRGHYFAIGTLALAVIIQQLLDIYRDVSGGASGFYVQSPESMALFGLEARTVMYYVGLVSAILMTLITYRLVRSRTGIALRTIKDDEAAASSLGVSPLTYKMVAFVVSSFFAGIAGALWGQYTLYLNAESTLGVNWTIITLVVVIIGGMGTIVGPVLGAGIYLVLDNTLSSIVGELATTVEGMLIILFIIFLPTGLYGFLRGDWRSPSNGEEAAEDNGITHSHGRG